MNLPLIFAIRFIITQAIPMDDFQTNFTETFICSSSTVFSSAKTYLKNVTANAWKNKENC